MTSNKGIRHAKSKAVPACTLAPCPGHTRQWWGRRERGKAPHLPVVLFEVAQALPDVGVGGDVWHDVRALQKTPTFLPSVRGERDTRHHLRALHCDILCWSQALHPAH